MTSTDAAFSGSIPAIYDRYLAELLFNDYATDIARRTAALKPQRVLETAAGTGLATAAIVEQLPDASLVATDLNQAMIDVAAKQVTSPNVEFRAADAQSLPFEDEAFDAVVMQFGMMFLPDRAAGYSEARRVLRPGGHFIFNVWNSLDKSPIAQTVHDTVAALYPDDPPSFFTRVPWGYHDIRRIEQDVRAAGFSDVQIETVAATSRADSPTDAAIGLCQGTPLRPEIETRGDLQQATNAAAEGLTQRFGSGPLSEPLSAHVVTAVK
jgi:ubiquinone/menaquinone biosynthesis C-methylase UbiE